MNTMILNTALQQYANIFTLGMVKAQALAFGTLGITFAIDFALKILTKLEDGDHIKTIIWSIIKWGAYYYLIKNWPYLVNIVLDSFIKAGNEVANGGISDALMKQPSFFIDTGFKAIDPLVTYIKTLHILDDAFVMLMTAISMVGTLLAFGIMSIQVFVTYIEFFLLSSLAVIFVPFGAWKHTSFMAEKAFGVVIGFGVKFAVLTTVASASVVMLRNVASSLLDTDPTWQAGMLVLLLASSMAYLSWNAPAVASSMMSGGPSLTAGSAIGSALSAGSAVVGGASVAKAAGGALAGAAGSAARGAAGIAGAAAGGAAGKSGLQAAAGALGGMASHVGGGIKGAIQSSSTMQAASSVKDAFSGAAASASGGGKTGSGGSSGSTDTNGSSATDSRGSPKSGAGSLTSAVAGNGSGGSSDGYSADAKTGLLLPSSVANSRNYKPVNNSTPPQNSSASGGAAAPPKANTSKANSSSTNANHSSKPGAISTIAQLIGQAQSAIPPEASPSGGIHVPIKD